MAAVPPAGVPAVAAVPIVVDPAEIVRDVLEITGLSNIGVNVNNRQTSKFANANGIYEIKSFTLHSTSERSIMVKFLPAQQVSA